MQAAAVMVTVASGCAPAPGTLVESWPLRAARVARGERTRARLVLLGLLALTGCAQTTVSTEAGAAAADALADLGPEASLSDMVQLEATPDGPHFPDMPFLACQCDSRCYDSRGDSGQGLCLPRGSTCPAGSVSISYDIDCHIEVSPVCCVPEHDTGR